MIHSLEIPDKSGMFDYFRGMARYTAGGELAHGQDDAQVVVVVPFLAYLLWQHSPTLSFATTLSNTPVGGQIQQHDAQWQFLARKVVLAMYRSIC